MAVHLYQLRKAFFDPDGGEVPVIDVEYFSLLDGEQVALVGSSGSGKTTLLHLTAGILTPDSGRITYDFGPDGKTDIAELPEHSRDVFRGRNLGYIFQTHHLLGGFTALENIMLGMSFATPQRRADRDWAIFLLNEVGLGERANYKPARLSVGQQQRVAVARALANRPRVVLADEPTGALDARNAQQVLDLIRKLCADVHASLLLVSHDQSLTRQLPRSVALTDINRAAHTAGQPLP